ncbi:MAG: hypothetical protein IJN03_01240 [Bacilli bacterium]|nr:hypothetical protein [Bacilli bacterium]
MDYKDLSDSELYMLVAEENEEAKDILFEKYNYIIDIVLKKYSYVASRIGIDYKELYSEALYGFSDALASYQEDKDASLPTFISLCINRRLQKVIVKASTTKNKVLQDAYSLDLVYEQFGLPLVEMLSDNNENDPLSNMTKEEAYEELLKKIKEALSESEYEVFNFMVNNLSYNEIAIILDKTPKQIDNTMQRIKHKIKDILKARTEE